MPRIARFIRSDQATVYHVISRTALPGLPIKDTDKDYLLGLIKRLSRLYFVDVLGFAIMGNHFHLVARMHPEDEISNSDIIKKRRRGQSLFAFYFSLCYPFFQQLNHQP